MSDEAACSRLIERCWIWALFLCDGHVIALDYAGEEEGGRTMWRCWPQGPEEQVDGGHPVVSNYLSFYGADGGRQGDRLSGPEQPSMALRDRCPHHGRSLPGDTRRANHHIVVVVQL